MNQTNVVVFDKEASMKYYETGNALTVAVGVKNSIIILDYDLNDGLILFRTTEAEPTNSNTNYKDIAYWHCEDGRFSVTNRKRTAKEMPYDEFLRWLKVNLPEDLQFFLYHPEISRGLYNE